MMKKIRILFALLLLFVAPWLYAQAGDDIISLEGTWKFRMDPENKGITERWFTSSPDETITLPGSMSENNKGYAPTLKTQWTGSIYDSSWFYNPRMEKYRQPGNLKFPFWLTPDKYYVGAAWYQKEVNIPKNWKEKRIVLFLERPHWQTTIWVDDKEVGSLNSLSVPHRYDITQTVAPGKHTITIRVDNQINDINPGADSHSITDHTQGNWNGIVGQIKLLAGSPVYFEDIRVFPNVKAKTAKAVMVICNTGKPSPGQVRITAELAGTGKKVMPMVSDFTVKTGTDTLELEYPMGEDTQLWDEFTPALYTITFTLTDKTGNSEVKNITIGMRDFKANGKYFEINGKRTYLRGTVENCVFPLTGYAPMDEGAWTRVFEICRESGLNHMRFHSFCPPEAAFAAADKLGFYLQPEGPSWANHGTSLGDNKPIDKYIWDETERIVKEYGNHPSFCMFAYGNEPRGNYVVYLAKWLNHWKIKDNRRLYTSASIGGSWKVNPESEYIVRAGPRGIKWRNQPESRFNYSMSDIKDWDMPYVTHEMGQWCVFPDFREIPKYTGQLKAKNFELFQEDLNDNHMGNQAYDFLMASGKLQALCYKTEIEALLRTKESAGFQLLALNDYPGQGTALVGILNALWEEKGYITKKKFSRFCNQTVPLACFPKFVFTNTDTFAVDVEVAHSGPNALENVSSGWKITDEHGSIIASGKFDSRAIPIGNGFSIGNISRVFHEITRAEKLNLEVNIDKYANDWDFWVYPSEVKIDSTNIYFCRELNAKAEEILNKGGSVFLMAAGKIENGKDVVQYFTPVFWNTSWFKMRPPHTTGILVRKDSPAFADFPTEAHSNYQWWYLVNRQQVMNLENFPAEFRPLVQPIDTWFLNRRLALLFEAKVGKGKIMVCSADLQKGTEQRPVVKQLLYSLTNYMHSAKFTPACSVDIATIRELFEVKARNSYNSFTKNGPDELRPKH
jgi:hypothetical protein